MNLIRASSRGDAATVKKLLAEGIAIEATDTNGRTALIEAAWGGYLEIVTMLLKHKANINATDASGFTALMRATEVQELPTITLLVKSGANINTHGNVRGSTPLMLAAENGNTKILSLLLEHGAKINAVDQFEETALARAYRLNQLDAIRLLESKGATRKPARNSYNSSDNDLRPITRATKPKLNADAEEFVEDEVVEPEEPFEEEES